jgi:hypothetical protein
LQARPRGIEFRTSFRKPPERISAGAQIEAGIFIATGRAALRFGAKRADANGASNDSSLLFRLKRQASELETDRDLALPLSIRVRLTVDYLSEVQYAPRESKPM